MLRKSGKRAMTPSDAQGKEFEHPASRMKDLSGWESISPNGMRVEVILESKNGTPIAIPLLPNERPIPMGNQDFVMLELRRIPRLRKLLGILGRAGILEEIR